MQFQLVLILWNSIWVQYAWCVQCAWFGGRSLWPLFQIHSIDRQYVSEPNEHQNSCVQYKTHQNANSTNSYVLHRVNSTKRCTADTLHCVKSNVSRGRACARSHNASLYVPCGNAFCLSVALFCCALPCACVSLAKPNAAGSIVETLIFRVWIISGDVYLFVHTRTQPVACIFFFQIVVSLSHQIEQQKNCKQKST